MQRVSGIQHRLKCPAPSRQISSAKARGPSCLSLRDVLERLTTIGGWGLTPPLPWDPPPPGSDFMVGNNEISKFTN